MATVEQRVSYIEGRLDALATKADLTQAISELRAELSRDMLDPRHGTSVSRINDALRLLGREAVLVVRPLASDPLIAVR